MFPKDFMWGAATAAYQIEGAVHEDGRGESIWDRFSHTPGKTDNGDTGDVACDHYHRYAEDVQLMTALGIKAYRFSIAWPRIFPTGKGDINEAGLAFYDRLVDSLLKAGITPYVTLYHWDLPQALEEEGGWLNRNTAHDFAHYADAVSRRLGDRIQYWMTFNEPLCSVYHGYTWGVHAPGHVDPTYAAAAQATHHLYLAHGQAVQALRANLSSERKVGIVLNVAPIHAVSDSDADNAAAYRVDGLTNRWFLDPIFKGEYPTDVLALLGDKAVPPIQPGDMQIISTPIDMLGVNYYFRQLVQDDSQSVEITRSRTIIPPEAECTDTGWEIYADGLRELLVRIYQDYHPAELYVTENGCAVYDVLEPSGRVHDLRRIAYLRDHFQAAFQSIQQGVPLKGYFIWSFLDNFEWASGYSKRFGVTYVDYTTQKRHPKDSFAYYQSVIRTNVPK